MNSGTRKNLPKSGVAQTGVGLVELLVGMAIGLVVMMAVGYVFISSLFTTKTLDDLSRMQETARLALDTIGQYARHAGYSANVVVVGGFRSFRKTHDPDSHANTRWIVATDGGGSGVGATPDSFTVRYDAFVTGEADCVGTEVVGGAAPPNVITATFSINGTDLRCSNGTTAQPLFSNIENMQVEYGLDDGSAGGTSQDGAADSYVTGASIASGNYDDVVAIRVRLLVRSERDEVSPVSQTYSFNGGTATATDRRLRQEYVATFAIRNVLP